MDNSLKKNDLHHTAAERASEPLDGADRSEIIQGEGKGGSFPLAQTAIS